MHRPRRRFPLIVSSALALIGAGAVFFTGVERAWAAAPGDFDTSFGSNGPGWVRVPAGYLGARAMVVQPDGRIVVAGSHPFASPSMPQGLRRLAVWRFLPNGSPDESFNG